MEKDVRKVCVVVLYWVPHRRAPAPEGFTASFDASLFDYVSLSSMEASKFTPSHDDDDVSDHDGAPDSANGPVKGAGDVANGQRVQCACPWHDCVGITTCLTMCAWFVCSEMAVPRL